MAKERATYLSHQTGRVGNVVFRKYRNGVVTSVRPIPSSKAPTDKQLFVRIKFSQLVKLARAFAAAAMEGFYPLPQGMLGARNIFVKTNKNNVHVSNDGEVEINYSKLQVSSGVLPLVNFKTPVTDTGLTVTVPFDAESDIPGADDKDKVFIVVYQPELQQGILSAPALRSVGTIGVKVPALWSGTEVHIYGFVVGGGRLNDNDRSTTMYLGKSTIE